MVLPNASGSRGAPRDSLGVSAASRRGRCGAGRGAGAGQGRAGQGRGGRKGQAGGLAPVLGLAAPSTGQGVSKECANVQQKEGGRE